MEVDKQMMQSVNRLAINDTESSVMVLELNEILLIDFWTR